MSAQRKMTFAIVVGNRGFFPDHLAKTGREEIISVLEAAGAKAIVLGPEDSNMAPSKLTPNRRSVRRTLQKARREIDGIIVTLPNFGEERGIVDAIRLSGLKVPVLVQATPDRSDAMTIATRRDSFCGKMSACNNLMQYGIPYSLTTLHTESLGLARIQRRPGMVLRRSAASSRASRISASAPSARVPRPSTPSATPSAFLRPAASPSRPSTSPKSSAASTA